jgi:hypothetical protein
MMVEPVVNALTVPVVELVPVTVATEVLEDAHVDVVAGVPEPVSVNC